MNKTLGFTTLFFTSILYSTTGVFVRKLDFFLSPSQQIYYRFFVGFIVLVFIKLIKHQKIDLSKYFKPETIFFGLTIPASYFLFNLTILTAKLSVGISFYFIGALVTAILINSIINKQKLDAHLIITLLISILGFVFLSELFLDQNISVGAIFALLSGWALTTANHFKQKLQMFDTLDLLLIICFYTTVALFAYSFLNGETFVKPTTDMSIILFLYLLVAISVEYLVIIGFRNYNLYLGSIVLSLEIVFTGILGYVFYQESLTIYEIIGTALVFLAVVISNLRELGKNS